MKPVDCTENGKCSNCGNCCGNFLPLTPTEINIIRLYIKEHDIQENKKTIGTLTCPFRDDEKRICTIYEVRPLICKVWHCDRKPSPKDDKRLLKSKRPIINMRSVFFGRS